MGFDASEGDERRTAYLLVAIVPFFIAAVFVTIAISSYRLGRASESWPNVKVTHAGNAYWIAAETRIDSNGDPVTKVGAQYEFQVDGQKYTVADKSHHRTSVYYDPASPEKRFAFVQGVPWDAIKFYSSWGAAGALVGLGLVAWAFVPIEHLLPFRG